MFGSVAASGVRTLGKVAYDNNNMVVVAKVLADGGELADLPFTDIERSLAGHPRLGEHTQITQSAAEQARIGQGDASVLAALQEGNQEYETKFGHVFLLCAAGRTADETLAILRQRLTNDPEVEHIVTRTELAKINRRRLEERI